MASAMTEAGAGHNTARLARTAPTVETAAAVAVAAQLRGLDLGYEPTIQEGDEGEEEESLELYYGRHLESFFKSTPGGSFECKER